MLVVFFRGLSTPPVVKRLRLGLDGLRFTGAVPVSLRMPEADADKLEAK